MPIVYGVGSQYKVSKQIGLRTNVSKNYRFPTLNDLYWEIGGNPSLLPEESLSYEAGIDLNRGENFKLNMGVFVNEITNQIQWLPGFNGVWSPRNIGEVKTKGVEVIVANEAKWRRTIFHYYSNYTYIQSRGSNEQELKKVEKNVFF